MAFHIFANYELWPSLKSTGTENHSNLSISFVSVTLTVSLIINDTVKLGRIKQI